MEVALGTADALTAQADLLAVGVFADLEPGPGAERALEALGAPLRPLLESRGFSGKTGESVALPTLGRLPAATLLLIGLGLSHIHN
jgi:leucyl aminopeptidase